eukprot:1782353-Pyramimonas_sp.AAC.1
MWYWALRHRTVTTPLHCQLGKTLARPVRGIYPRFLRPIGSLGEYTHTSCVRLGELAGTAARVGATWRHWRTRWSPTCACTTPPSCRWAKITTNMLQSQSLNRHIPRPPTNHSPSIGIYLARRPIIVPQ